jgi:hypothetical protein
LKILSTEVGPRSGKKSLQKSAQKKILDSVHDAWVSALKSPDGLIYGDEKNTCSFAVGPVNGSAHSHLPLLLSGSVSGWETGWEKKPKNRSRERDTKKGKGIALS